MWRRAAWSGLLAIAVIGWGALLGSAVAAMAVVMVLHDDPAASIPLAVGFLIIAGALLALAGRLLTAVIREGNHTPRSSPSTVATTAPSHHHRCSRRDPPCIGLKSTNLTKRYGRETVVDDLSFTVEPGRVTGFLGPNGAGKSTAMKVLLDLAKATKGSATIDGKRYRDLDDPARTVGVVLEPNAFHPGRSARNHLKVLADGGGFPSARVEEMLDPSGLAKVADRRAGAFSLGMRQRLSLAAALLGDPPVVVLDEPGNGLDPQGIRWLRDLLRARAEAGGTVFVSSHLLAEVEHLADDVVVINRGRLVTTGALADLQHAGTTVRTPHPAELTRGTLHRRGRGPARVRRRAGRPRDEHQRHRRPRPGRQDRPARALPAGRLTGGPLPRLDTERDSRSHFASIHPHPDQGRSLAMTWLRLIKGELRKLVTTKILLGFLLALVVIAAIDAAAVAFGTDMDGSKTFISTAEDQVSLMAFGFNAMIGTALFGAIAVAREYGHTTVVPMFLTSPRRHRAVLAQLTAVLLAGAMLGLVGEAMIVAAVGLALPSTEFAFLASAGDISRLMLASMLAGMAGAVLGAGIGALIRNLGGAVTVTVLLLFIAPGMAVQLINEFRLLDAHRPLLSVVSGVTTEISVGAALLALAAWALLPAAAGLVAVQRRDVV